MKQFWPLSHENYPAKVDQLKIFDDQKIQNPFCTTFFVLTPRITFLRTKIWTFQISSTAKMSKFEKLVRKGPIFPLTVTSRQYFWIITEGFFPGGVILMANAINSSSLHWIMTSYLHYYAESMQHRICSWRTLGFHHQIINRMIESIPMRIYHSYGQCFSIKNGACIFRKYII